MSKDKQDNIVVSVERSKRLIGLDEFSKSIDLRIEELAGFRVYTKDQKYRSRDDWKVKLLEYQHRDLKEG